MSLQNQVLFELIEQYAEVNIYFNRKNGTKAERPAIIITSNVVGHFPKAKGHKFTLWFGLGIERFTFKTFKEAALKAQFMLQKASEKRPDIVFRFSGADKTKFEKLLEEKTQVG